MCDASPRLTPSSTLVLPELKPRPAYPAGFNWQDANRKLYRAGLDLKQRNRERLLIRAYLRHNCVATKAALDAGITERTLERHKAQWRMWGIHVPTHNQRRKNTDNLSGCHPYALKATENTAFENTVTGTDSVLRNTEGKKSLESIATGIVSKPAANTPPILPTMARSFTAAEKTAFSQQLFDTLRQRRIHITPEECGRLLGIGLSRLPHETGHTLFVFLAGRLRSPATRDAFRYAIRCILTRQRAGYSPPAAAPAVRRSPITPQNSRHAFSELQTLAAASPPDPSTTKHRIGSFHSMKGILKIHL
jgi:hypothetical protein